MQREGRVERLLNGVFERFAHSVQNVPARGGSGILKPHAETEKQAPRDCFAFAPKRLLVLRNDPRQLGVNVGIEIAGEVGGGLANGRQQLTDAGEVVALSVDFCGWREGDPEIGTESEMWPGPCSGIGSASGSGGSWGLFCASARRRLISALTSCGPSSHWASAGVA